MIERWFTQTFTRLVYAQGVDPWGGNGGETYTPGAVFSGYIQPRAIVEPGQNGKIQALQGFILYCGADVTIAQQDRISFDSKTYEVRGVQDRGISGLSKHQEVVLELIDA